MDAPPAPPPGALLVRIPLARGADLATLPRVPAPHQVTVTVADPTLRAQVDRDALTALGYHLLGGHQARSATETAEALLLVRGPLLDGQPAWARALLHRADRVFDCDLGPVRHVFQASIARHLAG